MFNSIIEKPCGIRWGKKGINENMVECLKMVYDDVQCCVKWSYEKVTSVKQDIGVRQGCSLSPYLFNVTIIIDDIIEYIREKSTHASIVGNQTISDFVFAVNLAIGFLTVNGLQKGIDQMAKFCNKWDLKCNFD